MKRMKVKTFLIRFWKRIALPVLLVLVCAACTAGASSFDGENQTGVNGGFGAQTEKPAENAIPDSVNASAAADSAFSLEQIAEIERAGAYFPGLGLAESAFREKAGDYTGAAIAAYKELSWAYGYGFAESAQVEERLQNTLTLLENTFPSLESSAFDALRGCMAFAGEDWEKAEELLARALQNTLPFEEEPDSFLRWMLLVCALEREGELSEARSAYSAIRARYALLPEYWYRGARAFSANEGIAASYAEQCINLSSQGPFAVDCRKILAGHIGLAPNGKDISGDVHSDIRTRAEIEKTIRSSVSMNDPLVLEELYPLMALPENPYTLYALGAMKALAAVPAYRSFFIDGALKSPGRLGERLNYIARG